MGVRTPGIRLALLIGLAAACAPGGGAEWTAGTLTLTVDDAGHIAQNLALAAEALGHKSCPIAAIFDDEMNALIGADGKKESVIYVTAVGTK